MRKRTYRIPHSSSRASGSNLTVFVYQACETLGVELPATEYRFHPERRWRLDFAWPERKIALEVEGGVWVYGRHNHPRGFLRDMEKYNELAAMGWRLIRLTPQQVRAIEPLAALMGRMIQSERASMSG